MTPELIIGTLIAIALLGLFICYRFARALTDERPRYPEYRVNFDVPDPLSPEPFVDAVETDTAAPGHPPRCYRCGQTMVLSPRGVCWMCSCMSTGGRDAA